MLVDKPDDAVNVLLSIIVCRQVGKIKKADEAASGLLISFYQQFLLWVLVIENMKWNWASIRKLVSL